MTEEIREKIVEIAGKNMMRLGIRAVSIDDLCKDLGISKKTFYVYFATKDELVEAILHEQELQMDKRVDEHLVQSQSVLDIIGQNIDIIVERTTKLLQPLPFLHDLMKYYPRLFEAHKKVVFVSTKQHIIRFLQHGIDEKVFFRHINVPLTAEFIARLHQHLLEEIAEQEDQLEELSAVCCHGMGLIICGLLSETGKKLMEERIQSDHREKIRALMNRDNRDNQEDQNSREKQVNGDNQNSPESRTTPEPTPTIAPETTPTDPTIDNK